MKISKKQLLTINKMLGFVGYYAQKKEDNKTLDIYDKENNSLFITVDVAVRKDYIYFYFHGKDESIIEYDNKESDTFSKFSLTKDHCELELTINKENNHESISMMVDKEMMKVSISEYGDSAEFCITTKDGLRRFIKYDKWEHFTGNSNEISIIMTEGINSLTDVFNRYLVSNTLTQVISDIDLSDLSDEIISHPRNQELIGHIITSCEEAFKGITDFIIKNYAIFNEIVLAKHKGTFDALIEKVIDHDCDLPQIETQKKKD